MDEIDRRIVQCLLYEGRAPFRRIAEVAEVSQQTVARRYRALRADGAVRVRALPSHGARGEATWFVRIQTRPDATDALAEALAAREDTAYVSITSGGAEIVCQTRTDPGAAGGSVLHRLPRTAQVLAYQAHAVLHMHVGDGTKWLAFDDPLAPDQLDRLRGDAIPAPAPSGLDGALRDSDAPLLTELARDGRASAAELARATGWPETRVSTRLDALLTNGALHIAVDLAYPRFGFAAAAYLWLTVTPGDLTAVGDALAQYPETTFAAAVTGSANLLVTVTCRTLEDLYRYVTARVGALDAVRQVDVVPVLHRLKQAGTHLSDGRLLPG
ncbi:transcriptional regulator, AsnC family [Catenulispora acidiphila DSM 44928]|uniref:Transcriptional regulator, AsnC family n=1 Tax=Catenulispora acidiphila (strain DSM 44928 / JCM 14897 / NBRC 102108 / NRRL B-24433 / ID139908) TaxID=479433 RepID=C7Q5W3_CATAD|nr:AsnC family transcriptional regulator [Catenulispora acidiphila]ACU70060.1 transcriptional regulator, AsnC family [Catenulispora acidiphila DSM 44928]